MEDHEAWYEKLSFIEYRDMVRHTIRFPSEFTSLDQRPPPRIVSSSQWMKRIEVTLDRLEEKSSDVYIYEVPNELRRVNEGAYSPRIVSIGPLHHGEEYLLAGEEHKWKYMLYLIHRTPEEEERDILAECGKAIFDLEKEVRGNYAKILKFNTYELVEIMLVDGCFILELFLRSLNSDFYKNKDRIFRNAWMVPALQHDLALLENQIPFIVLKKLFEIFEPRIPKDTPGRTIHHLALSFFQPKKQQETTINIEGSQDVEHLLHLLHNWYILTSPNMNLEDKGTRGYAKHLLDVLHNFFFHAPSQTGLEDEGTRDRGFEKCATQLFEAGVEFKKGKDGHLLDITFSDGVLTIPPLHIDDLMDSLLRNLIAYEQCNVGSELHFTSYAFLIKSLIQSSADIELLQEKEIIKNDLSGVQDVLNLFNTISKEIILEDFYFDEPCSKVKAYRKSLWRRHCCHKAFWKLWCCRQLSALKRIYCPNAWRTISVLAAIVLLFLTGVQTYYSARPYLHLP